MSPVWRSPVFCSLKNIVAGSQLNGSLGYAARSAGLPVVVPCCLITVELFCVGFTKLSMGWSNAIVYKEALYKASWPVKLVLFAVSKAVPGLPMILFSSGECSKAGMLLAPCSGSLH